MNSTPTPKAIEPHNALIARADEQLAHAHEQIARADEELRSACVLLSGPPLLHRRRHCRLSLLA
jgi:hypothetical protein